MPRDENEDDDDRPRRPRNSRDDEDDHDAPPRRRPDDDDRDDFDDVPPKPKGGGNGLAITSMILGIFSLVMCVCCVYISPLLGIGALVTGFMGNSKGQSKGMAMTGIITGGIALLLSVVVMILYFTGAVANQFDVRQFQKK